MAGVTKQCYSQCQLFLNKHGQSHNGTKAVEASRNDLEGLGHLGLDA